MILDELMKIEGGDLDWKTALQIAKALIETDNEKIKELETRIKLLELKVAGLDNKYVIRYIDKPYYSQPTCTDGTIITKGTITPQK